MTPRATVTLRDVARATGTTAMTVSNIINGRAGQAGEELTARVTAACAALGYRPHASARRLRTNRRMAIGVIIVDPSPHYLSDPFTAALLAGFNDVTNAKGYSIVLQGAPPGGLQDLPLLRQIESDGFCLVTSGAAADRTAIFQTISDLGQPIVLVQDRLPRGAKDACALLQDDYEGGSALGLHLFTEPKTQAVMLVPGISWPAMERREAGLRSVMAGLAKPPRLHILSCGDESFDATQSALAAHIDRHGNPAIVIGGNDRMAIAAMKFLADAGARIPGDVRVTGFNGFDFWRYATPELTTVHSPAFQLGEQAARAMIERLDTGRFSFRHRVLPVRLAVNASSKAPDLARRTLFHNT